MRRRTAPTRGARCARAWERERRAPCGARGKISPARAAPGWDAGGMAGRAEADIAAHRKIEDVWPAIAELLRAVNETKPGTDTLLIETYTLEDLEPLYKKLEEAVGWRDNSDTRSAFSSLDRKVEEYYGTTLLTLEEEVGDRLFELEHPEMLQQQAEEEAAAEARRRELDAGFGGWLRRLFGAPNPETRLSASASVVDAVFAAHQARARR